MASSPAEEIILRTRGISMLFPGTVAWITSTTTSGVAKLT